MAEKDIKVSVVIPTFNRKESLEKALNALLKQTYPHDRYEIIVVDDYSTDGTKDLVESLAKTSSVKIVYCINNKKKGQTISRNIGFQRAKAEFVASTDDDAQAGEDWLEKGLSYFSHHDVAAVEGRTISKEIKRLPFWRSLDLKGGAFATCNMFYRKTVLAEIGGLDENLNRWENYGTDYILALNIMKKGEKIVYAGNAIVYHPPYRQTAKAMIRRALKAGAVPYLYKKYGGNPMPYLGFKLYLSIVAFFFIVFLISLIFLNYLVMSISFVTILCVLSLVIPGFADARLGAKLKAIIVYTISSFFSTAAFLYNCIRFRVFPNKKMFRR